jgi:hypothetical protein
MRTQQNKQLSKHFSLYEIIEGKALSQRAIELNWKYISDFNEDRFTQLCLSLEQVRSEINALFRAKNEGKIIGLTVQAGYRCKAWELMQGRSGNGQHPVSALDVTPNVKCDNLRAEILQYLYDKYSPRSGGWSGGFAIGWQKPKGNFGRGFVHFDNRPSIARWEY